MPPQVSVIIPCYNEQSTIALLLDALLVQSFPQEAMQVVIADGESTDETRQVIATWQKQHPQLSVRVVPNPTRIIPAALNVAIAASTGAIIIRMDAHSKPAPDYVAQTVQSLEKGQGHNVGGVWEIQPGADTVIARSIAAAAGHPIGVGDALYRYTSQAGTVDTVPFGGFRRSLLDEIGLFDETLLTNEDYEFNTRIRQAGGTIYLNPKIRSLYYARSTLKSLAQQYWRYGYWKLQMLRRYPHSIRWRQILPPLFVFSMLVLLLTAPFFQMARWFLGAITATYLFIVLLAGIQLAIKHRRFGMVIGVPLAIATMHFCWGAGFLWSLVHPPKSQ